MANDKWIENLAKKLKEHSSEVNPRLWQGISSQVGTGATSVAGGLGFAKITGIISLAITAVVATYFTVNSSTKESEAQKKETSGATPPKRGVIKVVGVKSPTIEKHIELSETPIKESIEKQEVIKDNQIEILPSVEEQKENKIYNKAASPIIPKPILTIKDNTIEKAKEEEGLVVETKAKTKVEAVLVMDNKGVNQASTPKPSGEFKKLPNTFTPNNDGVNDLFFVESTGMKNYVLVVLDERSRVVWQTNDQNEKWDGLNLGGEKVMNGNYIYYITAEDQNGKSINTHQRLLIQ